MKFRYQDISSFVGFTLLEIMLAMLVLGMVVAMISASLSGSVNVMDATMKQGDVYYQAQVAMERLSADLASALLTEDIEFIGGSSDDSGSQSILLSFASLGHLVLDPEKDQPGIGVISYAVQPDREHDGHFLLLRSDVLYRPQEENREPQETEAFILCDRLRSVTFSFLDAQGEEQEAWDTTVNEEETEEEKETGRRLPAAVVCRLEFWVDEEHSVPFQTTVLLPAGVIQPEPEEDA
jgi:type II secretory pathway pseudopilin PulG